MDYCPLLILSNASSSQNGKHLLKLEQAKKFGKKKKEKWRRKGEGHFQKLDSSRSSKWIMFVVFVYWAWTYLLFSFLAG